MTIQISTEVELDVEECCNCGTPFAIEHTLRTSFLRHGTTFYCPNGHPQVYTKPIEDRLKEAQRNLEAEKRRADGWKQEAELAASKLKETRSELRATKKRISGGVCPCCHRQFVTLERHMKAKHPDYAQAE